MSQNGKGDKQRPTQIPPDEMAERWERTFGGTTQEERFRKHLTDGIRAVKGTGIARDPWEPEPKPETGRP